MPQSYFLCLDISQSKKKVNANFQGVGSTGLICCWNCKCSDKNLWKICSFKIIV